MQGPRHSAHGRGATLAAPLGHRLRCLLQGHQLLGVDGVAREDGAPGRTGEGPQGRPVLLTAGTCCALCCPWPCPRVPGPAPEKPAQQKSVSGLSVLRFITVLYATHRAIHSNPNSEAPLQEGLCQHLPSDSTPIFEHPVAAGALTLRTAGSKRRLRASSLCGQSFPKSRKHCLASARTCTMERGKKTRLCFA